MKQDINSPLDLEFVSQYIVLTHFKISKRTLDTWHVKEGLPKYKLGKVIVYKESEIQALIEKHKKVKGNRNKK
jgi:hypothetical protein